MLCTGSFETRLTPAQVKLRAKEHWDWWRLVLDAGLDYNTVFNQMLPDEIAEANAAFDLLIKAKKGK